MIINKINSGIVRPLELKATLIDLLNHKGCNCGCDCCGQDEDGEIDITPAEQIPFRPGKKPSQTPDSDDKIRPAERIPFIPEKKPSQRLGSDDEIRPDQMTGEPNETSDKWTSKRLTP